MRKMFSMEMLIYGCEEKEGEKKKFLYENIYNENGSPWHQCICTLKIFIFGIMFPY